MVNQTNYQTGPSNFIVGSLHLLTKQVLHVCNTRIANTSNES